MNRSDRRRWSAWTLAVILAFALIAASCGDDGTDADAGGDTTSTAVPDDPAPDDTAPDGTAPADSTTTAPVELTASWTGVTEEVIRLGFTTTDLVRLREMGLVDIDRGDPQVALDALIADVNARGGIHGRMLEAYLEVIVPVDATAADEACVRMTEDIGVFAVLGPFVGPNSDLNPCINSRNATIIVGGQPNAEQLAGVRGTVDLQHHVRRATAGRCDRVDGGRRATGRQGRRGRQTRGTEFRGRHRDSGASRRSERTCWTWSRTAARATSSPAKRNGSGSSSCSRPKGSTAS